LHVRDVLAGPIAAAEAVLTPEERELGVALIDLGGGTTDLVVYLGGAILHTAVLPVGGGHVTNDVAAALRTPFAEAERLKQRYGSAVAAVTPNEQSIEVAGLGGRAPHPLARRALAEVIEPRAEEVLNLVKAEIVRSASLRGLASGVVLTGGGAVLEHMTALAERVFKLPVRVGVPLHLNGLVDVVASPMYSTAVGLVLHGLKAQGQARHGDGVLGQLGVVRERMMGWLREFF
jgi:cell division protein FtsA